MKKEFPIRLTEELVLLMLNEQNGYLEMVPGWDFSCVMAGAVIADLALANRIDTDLEALHLIDPTPTGDKLLDPTLKEISETAEALDTQYWIERNTNRSEEIVTVTLERLVEKQILDFESGGFWTLSRVVSRTGSYPAADGATREEAKARVLGVIMNNDVIPDPRDIILVGLMHTCGGFKLLLSDEDYEERLERIEDVARMDLVGRSVSSAVKLSTVKPKTRRVLRTKPIPNLRITDLLRQRDFRTGNIPKAMYGIFETHGPVVRVPIKIGGQAVVAMIGPKANHWVNKQGRYYLRSKDYIQKLECEFGASRTLPGMDGAEHFKMRKALRSAYSRAALAQMLPELIFHCRQSIGQWNQGDILGATTTFQKHMSSQVSHLSIGVDCSQYIEELLSYQHRALVTHVQGGIPKFMLSTPKMMRAKKSIHKMLESIHSSHTPAQRKGKPPDLADALLELHQNDPQFLPETDITFPFVASMVASLYLGSALGFAVFAMVNNPGLHARIRQEAESIFGGERPPGAEEFDIEKVDTTHRLFLESERMYPVIPWQMRTDMNGCVFDGFEIPPETRLLICHTAPHYSKDLYKDPLTFDIDRYLPNREEHLAQGAYAPYGLGTHHCLGHKWVELQMAVNLLLIAYHTKLEIVPANYTMGINPFPTSAPRKKLKFRVAEIYNPI